MVRGGKCICREVGKWLLEVAKIIDCQGVTGWSQSVRLGLNILPILGIG